MPKGSANKTEGELNDEAGVDTPVKKSDLPRSVINEATRDELKRRFSKEEYERRFGEGSGAVFVSDFIFREIAIVGGYGDPGTSAVINTSPLDLNSLKPSQRDDVARILAATKE